ncbi:unknown [Tannerella sp. CAG:118]|nr:unknown [Tannerella sp. CAG:118]
MRTFSNIIGGGVLLLTSMFACNDPMEVDNAELECDKRVFQRC